MGLLARGQERKRLVLWGLVAIVMVAILSAVVLEQPESHEAKLLDAASQRFLTLFDSREFNDPSSSLRWRDFEYSYALPHILSNPFVGLGLGANYRPLTSKDYEGFEGRAFIHNGHMYVLLKSGVFGYVGLMWFIVCVLVRGLRYWRKIPDPYMRAIVLAFTLVFLEVSIVSIVEPYVMDSGWTPVIGTIAGINEVIFWQLSKEASAIRQSS
jgi:O-antigen ligase